MLNAAYISQGSAVTHLRCGGNMAWVLLQTSRRIQQWKYFENQPTSVKVMNECIVAHFFDSLCVCTYISFLYFFLHNFFLSVCVCTCAWLQQKIIKSTHCFQTKYTAMKWSVSEQPNASSISGHIPTDMTAALCCEVKWHHETILSYIIIQLLKDTSRLTC